MAELSETNRHYFNQKAVSSKVDFGPALELLRNEILDRRLWISDKWTDTEAGKGVGVRLLDYACGTGNLSIALAPFLTEAVGLDVSDSMVDEFNKDAQEAGLSDRLVAYRGNLVAETVSAEFSDPKFFDFDLVLIGSALHHLADPGLALKRLADRLKKGGVCLVIDFLPHGHDDHKNDENWGDAAHTTNVHGFSSHDMEKLFENAGLSANFDYKVLEKPLVFTQNGVTRSKPVFMARAQRI